MDREAFLRDGKTSDSVVRNLADAETLHRTAIGAGRIGLGEKNPLTLTSVANLGTTLSTASR